MSAFVDLTGRRFGRLTVICRSGTAWGQAEWLCRCDCGTETKVCGRALRTSNTRSCGCLHREWPITHGASATLEYKRWTNMICRCTNPNHRLWRHYGGRGIQICERWKGKDGFQNFISDMGPRPSRKHSIDRIDNDGNYEPENCRWATRREQCNNMSTNRLLTDKGITLTAAEWARRAGLQKQTLLGRLQRGWPLERALTAPLVLYAKG